MFLFAAAGAHRALPSFPTRRSSDLALVMPLLGAPPINQAYQYLTGGARSEEHTSELQSLTNLVCRLLLEKKKRLRAEDAAKHGDADPPSRRPQGEHSDSWRREQHAN